MIRDLRFAFRTLRKNIWLTAVAVLTLAIGIGANTAIFSIVNGLLIRPLPYHASERLVTIHEKNVDGSDESKWMTREQFVAWEESSKTIEGIAAFNPIGVNVRLGDSTQRVQGARVSPNFFSMLGVSPAAGRVFNPQDAHYQSQRAAILDYRFWQDNFGGEKSFIGRTITIDNELYAVVGVLPKSFDYHYHQDVWIPLRFTEEERKARGDRALHVIALQKQGTRRGQVQAELNTISKHVQMLDPERSGDRNVMLVPLQEEVTGNVRPAILMLQGAVGLVLLMICVNLTNLLMAHSFARQGEIAVRLALGASRFEIMRQFIAESLLLSFVGGSFGLVVALIARNQLLNASSVHLPFTAAATPDSGLFFFTMLLSLITGAVVGLVPVLQLSRGDVHEILKSGGSRSIGGSHTKWRTALVTAEIAISVILLVGAGLMIKSFWRLQAVDPGFNPSVLKLRIALPAVNYPDDAKRLAFYREGMTALKSLPGAQMVAMINWLPLSGIATRATFELPESGEMNKPEADVRVITPEYFGAMQIPVKRGRTFSEYDGATGTPVLIATESMIRKYFVNRNPIGRIVKIHFNNTDYSGEIIGVVGDVRNESLDAFPQPAFYVFYLQAPWNTVALREFVVRTLSNPESLAESARQKLWSINPNVPVYQVSTMSRILDRSLSTQRFNKNLISIFGMIALVLVIIGIYGLITYSVYQRTREIGVRMALGASRTEIIKLVVTQALRIALGGVCLGLVAASLVTRTISKLIFGVGTADPATFASIGLMIVLVAIAASCMPAWKASRVSPLTALRWE